MLFNKNTKKTLIIAEIGNNHEGDISNAKKLIKLASKAGVDAVKFQTFITDKFINPKDIKRFNQLRKFELGFKNFKKLYDYSKKQGLKFISTPFDLESAKFLNKYCDIIKISSGDNNFFPLLDYFLDKKKKIIISTGMMSSYDLEELSKHIKNKLDQKKMLERIALLHCVTSYPALDKDLNLNSIPYLIKNYKFTIGYSDHSIGHEACISAVALGAKIIEKHFTINKNFSKFRDHKLSADFKEMVTIVNGIRKTEDQLGEFDKKILKIEKKILKKVRRGIYAKKNLKKNQIINEKNIEFFRGSENNDYKYFNNFSGKKLTKNVSKFDLIKKNDLI